MKAQKKSKFSPSMYLITNPMSVCGASKPPKTRHQPLKQMTSHRRFFSPPPPPPPFSFFCFWFVDILVFSCSRYVPMKFPRGSQKVPNDPNVFPKMLPIVPPLTHMLYPQLSFFHLYRWAKKKTLDFNIRTTILGSLKSFSILFCDGRIKMAPGKRKSWI